MTDLPIVAVANDILDNRFWASHSQWIGNDDDGGFGLQKEEFEKIIPLAESLLIAVEALEKIETEDVKWSADEAKEAINRIRSLLPKT